MAKTTKLAKPTGFPKYTICHNDDDPKDPNHRRVPIVIDQNHGGGYEILVGGEPPSKPIGPFHSISAAERGIRELWSYPGWDLRKEPR